MKRFVLLLLMTLGLVSGLAACSSGTSSTLSPADFQELTQKPGVTVVDVRTPAEFAQGHLPNAVNIDVESPTFGTEIAKLDTGGTYAVYCRSGNRSVTAMDQMKAAGFSNVQDLDGGIVAWQGQGLPVA